MLHEVQGAQVMPRERAILRRGFQQPAFGLKNISLHAPPSLVEKRNGALGVGIPGECMRHCILQHEIVVTMFDGLRNFIPVVIRK